MKSTSLPTPWQKSSKQAVSGNLLTVATPTTATSTGWSRGSRQARLSRPGRLLACRRPPRRFVEVFDFLEDWSDRYQYIIELGEKLPPMPDELKTEATRVHGCQSTVFLHARKKPGTADVMEFLAASDAEIVRGELALLQKVYSGQRAGDVLAFDVHGFFGRLGLDQHLTMGRRNGLAEMVKRIRSFAAEVAGRQPTTPLK